ncbi:MAG: hypothetical protein ACRESU_03275, partial [Gammaproteobacteria bacterium]
MNQSLKSLPTLSLRPVTLAVLSALAVTAPLLAAATTNPTPGAPLDVTDFVVNTHTIGEQYGPRIARDAAGDFVVSWQSHDQAATDSDYDIYAQRYHADGTKNGQEFLVNTVTSDKQEFSAVAMDAAGDFVVAWQSDNQVATSSAAIYFQRFDASGTPVGTETLANPTAVVTEKYPAVAMDAAGDFVLVWTDYTGLDGYGSYGTHDGAGIFARRYQADGTPIDPSDFQVNSQVTGNQNENAVAMDAVGDFVAVWKDANDSSIKGRRFTLTGDTTTGTEFQLNTNTYANEYPYMGMDAQGDFVVGWEARYSPTSGTTQSNLYVRRYDKQGTALDTSEVEIYSDATTDAYVLGVAMDAEGDYVVEICNYGGLDGDGNGLFGELFHADGTLVSPAVPVTGHPSMFQVNTRTSGDQNYPAGVAMNADGDFVMTWTDYHGYDGDSYGIYARRFAGPELTDLTTTLTGPTGTVDTGADFSVTANVSNANASTGNSAVDANAALASGIGLSITVPSGATFKSASGTD